MSRAAGNKNNRALACLPTTSSYYTQQHLQKHKDSLIFSLPAHISLSVPPSSSPPLTFYHHKHPVDQSSSNSFHSHFTSSSSSHSLVRFLISILPDISFLLSFFPPIPASILICSWLASCWETISKAPHMAGSPTRSSFLFLFQLHRVFLILSLFHFICPPLSFSHLFIAGFWSTSTVKLYPSPLSHLCYK